MQPSSHSSVASSKIDFSHLKKLPLSNIITRGVEDIKVQQKLHLYYKKNKECIPVVLQRHPIEKEVFFIVAGEQPYFFAKEEGFETILSFIITSVDRDLDSLLHTLPHIHPYLHCLEQAYIYNFLLSHPSYTQEELSDLLSIGRSTISRILKLTRLPQILQQDLLQNQLRVSLAKEFSTITDFSMCMKLYACHQKKTFLRFYYDFTMLYYDLHIFCRLIISSSNRGATSSSKCKPWSCRTLLNHRSTPYHLRITEAGKNEAWQCRH